MRKIINYLLAAGVAVIPGLLFAVDADQQAESNRAIASTRINEYAIDLPSKTWLKDGEATVKILGRKERTPESTVNHLSAKANNWTEPSRKSEEIYVQAIRQWLASLEPDKRQAATRILREAHPVMTSLRIAIREKKAELASLSFSQGTRPEELPRLGQELQGLRKSLRLELEKLGDRLQSEAGVSMGPLGGDGFWIVPPSSNS